MFSSTIQAPALMSGYHLAPQTIPATGYEHLGPQTLPAQHSQQYIHYLPAQQTPAPNPLMFDQPQGAYAFQQPMFMPTQQAPNAVSAAPTTVLPMMGSGMPNQTAPLFLDYMWNPYLHGASSFACLSSSGYSSLQPSLDGINKLGLSTYGYASTGNIPAYFKNSTNINQTCTPTAQVPNAASDIQEVQELGVAPQIRISDSISSLEHEKLKLMESVSSIDANEVQQQRRGSKEETKKPVTFKTNILFKTVPCREYEKLGICPRGKQCQFAHGNEELRLPFTHPLYRTKLCPEFVRGGSCPRGVRCYHAHSVDQLRQYSLAMVIQCETSNASSNMNQLTSSFLTNTNSSSANSSFESIRRNGYPPVINPPKYASPLMNV